MLDSSSKKELSPALGHAEGPAPLPRDFGGALAWLQRVGSTLLLTRSLEVISSRPARSLAASIAILYAFGSMLLGGMLFFGPTGSVGTQAGIITEPYNPAWWNFPAVWVSTPTGYLTLPFFGTVAMVIVSLGVGIGMSVGMLLTYRVLQERRRGLGGATAASTAAGLTPAMIALVTLGACCSTTAAATAGIGVLAQSSGTTQTLLINNSWYLGVFQIGVLGVALLAQEQLLTLFRDLLPGHRSNEVSVEPSQDARVGGHALAIAALLRFALIAAGITWVLAMLASTFITSSVTAGSWVWWIFEQLLVAVIATSLALSTRAGLASFLRFTERREALVLRVALLLSGLCLLLWLPAPIAQLGPHGLLNEVLWGLGAPASWGAVSPGNFAGVSLALRWGLQFLLLGTFSVAVALRPRAVVGLLSPSPAASNGNSAG
jgi:hypothetical protein